MNKEFFYFLEEAYMAKEIFNSMAYWVFLLTQEEDALRTSISKVR